MKIQEYINKNKHLPELNRYVNYSDEFREQYTEFISNIQIEYEDGFKVCFIARKDELEQFTKDFESGKLEYDGQIMKDFDPYLIHYSKGFKDGYNNLKLSKKPNKNELVKILDATHGKEFPLFRNGIITFKSHDNKTGITKLLSPDSVYFEGLREGKMYKARFLFMENYLLFKKFTGVEQFENNKTEQIEPLELERVSHKVLILHELGILDHLKQTYSVLTIDSDTNLSKLLTPLLGDNIETIRAALKNLNTRTTKTIINKTSVRKVKAELTKLGIETKTLPDL